MCPHRRSARCGAVKECLVVGPATMQEAVATGPGHDTAAGEGPAPVSPQRVEEIVATLAAISQELAGLSRPVLQPQEEQLVKQQGEEAVFLQWRYSHSSVSLNVGGQVFPVSWSLLQQVPHSRLGRLARCRSGEELLGHCDSYSRATNELFFNHRNKNMVDILDYYRFGSLHISSDCCPMAFMGDLTYWGLDTSCLEPCCLKKLMECKEQLEWEQPKEEEQEEVFPEGSPAIQQQLWDLFEHPHTSTLARIIGVISISCIFISTIILTLDTMPYFQEHPNQIAGEFAAFVIIEAIYMAYFTVEFIIRFATCPSKTHFFKCSMNWIDLLAIIPYFVTVTLNSYGVNEEALAPGVSHDDEHVGQEDVNRTAQYFRLLKMARIVKTLRIIRIFKLARHSTGLQALGNTMKANYRELGLLFLLLGMGAIMFASLIFVFEKEDADTTFHTMLDAYWWAIITMTTVGYGDVSPVTGFGKVLGCFCAIFGVLVIGLPIPIIGNSFTKFYTRQKRWEKNESAGVKDRKKSSCNLRTVNIDGNTLHSERGL